MNHASNKFLGYTELASNTKVSTGTEEVLWRMEKIGTDTFGIFPADSLDLTLEVYGTFQPGYYLRLYDRTGGTNQEFILWKSDPDNCSGYPCTSSVHGTVTDDLICNVVPNPTSDYAELRFASVPEYPVNFEVYDLQGKQAYFKSNITENRFEFGRDLSNGIYILKVFQGNDLFTMKFVKY